MSNILWKSFNLCFSKFKCLPTITFSPQPTTDEQDHQDHNQTLFDIDHNPSSSSPSSLLKNFNSLYEVNYSDSTSTSKSLTTTTTTAATDDFFCESDSEYCLPDFSSAFASHRFFFSAPGSSNSIFGSTMEAPLTQDGLLHQGNLPSQDSGDMVGGGVAVQTYSPDPYEDFRRSMQEMIEARELTKGVVEADWEFLHKLLSCYLTLNPKHTHKFIVGAFADVTISLVSRSGSDRSYRKMRRQPQCATPSLPV